MDLLESCVVAHTSATGRGVTDTFAARCHAEAYRNHRASDGTIRIDTGDGPILEHQHNVASEEIDVGSTTMHDTSEDGDRFGSLVQDRSTASMVEGLEMNSESPLVGRIGLNTTEILFRSYESVRRRSRVDLLPDVDDSPLEAMVDSAALSLASETNE